MSKDNVVTFTGITRLDVPPARVLIEAAKTEFSRVLVIGITEEGEEYFASSAADGGAALWDIERAKLQLLRMADDE